MVSNRIDDLLGKLNKAHATHLDAVLDARQARIKRARELMQLADAAQSRGVSHSCKRAMARWDETYDHDEAAYEAFAEAKRLRNEAQDILIGGL